MLINTVLRSTQWDDLTQQKALCGQNSELSNVKAGGTDNSKVPEGVISPMYFLNYSGFHHADT